MVSPRLLITNNHVLGRAEEASRGRVEFNYQVGPDGTTLPATSFSLDPERFFLTDNRATSGLKRLAGYRTNRFRHPSTPSAAIGLLQAVRLVPDPDVSVENVSHSGRGGSSPQTPLPWLIYGFSPPLRPPPSEGPFGLPRCSARWSRPRPFDPGLSPPRP